MRNDSTSGEEGCICKGLLRGEHLLLMGILLLICCQSPPARAQTGSDPANSVETTEQRVEHLTATMIQAQAQIDAYQKQLLELRQQLAELQKQMAAEKALPLTASQPGSTTTGRSESESALPATLEDVKERQAVEESQVATHDVVKVETESKYPLKVSGLLLFNGFVNTKGVDASASPAYAAPGPGSTGLSLRQTVLGLDARGPHLLGATSHADLRVDFFADGSLSNYAASGVLRLRTAHAALDWRNTEAFVQMDRSILEPNGPSSLVAVAQPELAWAGNLWSWNPQIGASHHFHPSGSLRVEAEAALIDTSDPSPPGSTSPSPDLTQTERSRWLGSEGRIAFQRGQTGIGPAIGIGGYFSPHRSGHGERFDAWAGTMDLRMPLGKYFELTANAYRGQALAGLGGGGYVNYYYSYEGMNEYAHALDDVGGWAQLKAKAGERVEVNSGYGTDNPFAKEIQAATPMPNVSTYPGLARNRSFYSNVIFSPSAYLLFSLEYKRLWTNLGSGSTIFSDVIGIGAGYKF